MSRYTFLYDDACPMCQAYTSAFERFDVSRRCAFSEVNREAWAGLDVDRGRHEIPMRDAQTGEVRYGLDAMTWALSAKLPALSPLLRHPLLIAVLKPLYWLITYNRRVIAGTRPPLEGFDCAPDVHLGWRLTYIALALAFVAAMALPSAVALALAIIGGAGWVVVGDRLSLVGHLATVALMAAVVTSIAPVAWAVPLGLGLCVWECYRRFTPPARTHTPAARAA